MVWEFFLAENMFWEGSAYSKKPPPLHPQIQQLSGMKQKVGTKLHHLLYPPPCVFPKPMKLGGEGSSLPKKNQGSGWLCRLFANLISVSGQCMKSLNKKL